MKLIDAISQIQYVGEQNRRFLLKLRKECEALEHDDAMKPQCGSYQPPSSKKEEYSIPSMVGVIDSSLEAIEENNERYPDYLRDLRSSLDVVRISHGNGNAEYSLYISDRYRILDCSIAGF